MIDYLCEPDKDVVPLVSFPFLSFYRVVSVDSDQYRRLKWIGSRAIRRDREIFWSDQATPLRQLPRITTCIIARAASTERILAAGNTAS